MYNILYKKYKSIYLDLKRQIKIKTFQICSDIHLEFSRFGRKYIFEDIIKPEADYLILAGDIGYFDQEIYFNFFEYCSKNFKKVFYISGNHEYYKTELRSLNMDEIDDLIKQTLSKFKNIFYLNCDSYQINDILILGCTLWTYIKKNKELIQKENGDYRYILKNNKLITVEDTNNLFIEQFNWIKKEVKNNPDKKIIVITHHLPSFQLIDEKYKGNKLNASYATNLDNFIKLNPQIKYWICGHSHSSKNIKICNTTCILNAYGHRNEDWIENLNYKKNLYIELFDK